MKRLKSKDESVDLVDARILARLSIDARTPLAEIAREVRLSPPSVAERVRRLEEAGVIGGYSADLDAQALGYSLAAWLRIRPIPGRLSKVAEILEGLDQIVECDRVTGEDCFIAKAYARSVKDLERLIDRIIPYAMTNTAIIQSSPIKRRPPPIAR